MTEKRQMHLGWLMHASGIHPAGWLHPNVPLDHANSLDHYVEMARIAEAAKLDFLFQADAAGARDGNMNALKRNPTFMNILEPVTLLSALAGYTEKIGLGATVSTSYWEPYNLARQFASLDHLSHGRSGWNVVTSAHPAGGYNFGRDGLEPHAFRYRRAREFVEVTMALWDSWDDDAFVRDRHAGVYFNPERMHYLHHAGEFFKVRGPLNMARPPQGYPVIIQAGASEDGRELAAETAEVVFASEPTLAKAQAFYADVKGRMARFGRHPDDLKILPGLTVVVGRTEAEADEKVEFLRTRVHPDVMRENISEILEGIDLSDLDIDEPMPESRIPAEANRHKAFFDTMVETIRSERPTLRQLYESRTAGRLAKGDPGQVADIMQTWFESGAADGFMVVFQTAPEGLRDFAELVVPELQRRGLFRTDYTGDTLRDHLGLARPESRYASPPAPAKIAS
jgi:FMN-dependent oxidoreductase (nitrilotriacetate monooxygenase family)